MTVWVVIGNYEYEANIVVAVCDTEQLANQTAESDEIKKFKFDSVDVDSHEVRHS